MKQNPMLSKLMSNTQKNHMMDKVAAASRMKMSATQTDLQYTDQSEQVGTQS